MVSELIKQSRGKHDRLLEAVTKQLGDRSVQADAERLEIQASVQGQNQVIGQLVAKYNQQTETLANSLEQVML